MNLVQLFSTPLWQSNLPDFEAHKDNFTKCVNEVRENDPTGRALSNINGYQSQGNLTNLPELAPIFEFACQMGLKAAFDMQMVDCDVYVTAAWANINDSRAHFNFPHSHTDTFAGTFYLKVPENSGSIVFKNPGLNQQWQGAMLKDKKNKFIGESLKIDPTEGSVLIWPAYLEHGVMPNQHDEQRISISFNLICIPKEPVPHTK